MSRVTRPADQWSPLYYLASVGAGGLAVTFFMYLMFWVPHPGQPVPVVEDIGAALATASPLFAATIYLALAGIAVFAAMNLYLLVWNLRRTGAFLRSAAGTALAGGQGQTQMTAMPLALAMSINAMFILGLVFVPGLWGVVEYLFPLALAAFLAVGVLALRQVGRYLSRVIGHGGFDWTANNSLSQMLPAFALSMVGVGLAAPAAMSGVTATAGVALVLATVFLVIAVIYGAVKLVLGVRSMLEHGVAVEQAPTLLIVVPMVTVLSILLVRLDHALHVHFGGHSTPADMLVFLTRMLSVQLGFTLFGLTILAATGYIRRFVTGPETSVGSYALICPGVALSVLMHFWINKGLVAVGLIAKFGTAYWVLSGVAVALQLSMILLLLVLNRRHFLARHAPAQVPAE